MLHPKVPTVIFDFYLFRLVNATIMQFHVFTRVTGRKAQFKGACRFSCRRKVSNFFIFIVNRSIVDVHSIIRIPISQVQFCGRASDEQ